MFTTVIHKEEEEKEDWTLITRQVSDHLREGEREGEKSTDYREDIETISR